MAQRLATMAGVKAPSKLRAVWSAGGNAAREVASGVQAWGGRRSGEPPLVRGTVPLLGMAVPFSKNATEFLQRCRAEHGEVFTVYAAGKRMTFVCDPLSYSPVLRCPALEFEPVADQVMERAFDFPDIRGAVDLGALDETARKYLKGSHLADISTRMSREVFTVLHAPDGPFAERSGVLPLYRFIFDVIFAAGTEVIFGSGKACPQAARAFEEFDRDFAGLVAGMPKFMARDSIAGLRALTGPFEAPGEQPSRWISARQTVLAHLDETLRGRAQAAALWAVHANTIPTVFWTLAHVLTDPGATRAIEHELQTKVEAGPDQPLSVEDLERLELLDSATKEALRMAAGSMTVRRATEAASITTRSGTFAIREGDQVCLAPQLTHHDDTVFEQPETFRYNRFAHDVAGKPSFEKGGERAGFAFMPFGAGRHTCPGRFFAVNEVKIFAATLLRRAKIAPVTASLPGFDYSRIGLGVFPPKHDVDIQWAQR